jgi:hypothetical protein
MPVDLEQQILKVLGGMSASDRPTTFGDLARRFGAPADLIARCGRQLVDRGLARPSMVEIKGVSKLHGLLPQAVEEPAQK